MKFEDIEIGEIYITKNENPVKVLCKHETQKALFCERIDVGFLYILYHEDFVHFKQKVPLKNNMWVKRDDGMKVFITDLEKGEGFGVNLLGEWDTSTPYETWSFVNPNEHHRWQPMTEEEVVEFMLKEAKKRGYAEGVEVVSLYSNRKIIIKGFYHRSFISSLFYAGDLWGRGDEYLPLIMKSGEWAEIVEPKEITTISYFDKEGNQCTLEVEGEVIINKTKNNGSFE